MCIAITGGSGSLGRALIKRLTSGGADRIVTFSRDEQKRAALETDFGWHPGVRVFAGDIREPQRLPDVFHGCDVVVHAAARKVVTAHPDEPREMVATNVSGTMNVVAAARMAGVRQVLFISSDKAVHATNTYGMSKALAEQLVINENARTVPQGLRLSCLRYGNVLGSNGSVFPKWRALAAAGKPLPISDPTMTRFWLTLGQAVDFVLAALSNMRGGEIFIPHIPAASVATLAEAVAPGAHHSIQGIRPGGEKMDEELISSAEMTRTVRRPGSLLYVISPYQNQHMWDAHPWIDEPFKGGPYRSDVWPLVMNPADMRAMIEAAERPDDGASWRFPR